MATNRILAENTVSISELRKNPSKFIQDEPVAVLHQNKAAGYLVNSDLFELMLTAYENQAEHQAFTASFRPSAARLADISQKSARAILANKGGSPGEFTE